MRLALGMILVAVSGCSTEEAAKVGSTDLQLPQLYPPVRAATPSALILDAQYANLGAPLLVADGGIAPDANVSDAQAFDGSTPSATTDAATASTIETVVSSSPDSGQINSVDASAGVPDASAVFIPGDAGVPLPAMDGGELPVNEPGTPMASNSPTQPGGSVSPPGGSVNPPPPPGGMSTFSPTSMPIMPPPPPGGTGNSQPGSINLATAIQERFYSAGPTSLLRIVRAIDERIATLNTDPTAHPCLTSTPVSTSYALPGAQGFDVKLQCQQGSGSTWVAFGFDKPAAADGGVVKSGEGNDFYLVEGQASGMGGAYRVEGGSGNVEAWITVADQNAPNNSQVIMHLLTNKRDGTLELVLAGSGVGFCSAHLKTNADHLYVSGKTNGVAPPGSALPAGEQYCDAQRSGCFAAADLGNDLGAASANCSGLDPASFALSTELDASNDGSANVTPATLYDIFNREPVGVEPF
jgi:hypothetical protein